MMKSLLVVLTVVLSVFQYASGQGTCSATGGDIGDRNYMSERNRSRGEQSFYLYIIRPANCSGIINYFSYCYYRPEVAAQSYVFTFAIYRQSTVNGTYDNVSSAFIAERSSSDVTTDLGSGNFACVNLTVNDPVPVNAGDMLGACISDPPGNVQQLDIVGIRRDGANVRLLRAEASGCSADSVPSSVMPQAEMTQRNLLHLYANIVPLPETQPPPTTTAATTMETVPVTTAATTMATTMESTSAPVTTAPATMESTSAPATTMETVPVTTAATTMESTSAPVTTAPTTMATTMATTMESTSAPVTTAPTTMATTIATTMETVTVTTAATTMATTMETVPVTTVGDTTGPSTNTTGIPTGGANTGATAAAVVVILIILIVSIVIATVVFVLLAKKHKSTKRVYSVRDLGVVQDGIDNVMYSSGNASAGDGKSFTAVYEEVGLRPAAKYIDQSKSHYEFDEVEHTYEYEEASFSNSAEMNEYAYADVGAYKERHHGNTNDIVYESPLDEQAISYSKLLEKNREEDIYGSVNPFTVPASQEDEIYAQLKTWGVQAIALKDIEVVGHLGSGQFGSVEQGQWKRQGIKPVAVALKSLNKESSEEDKVKFLQEAAIMGQFRHPNVILLHGVVTRGKPIMLVVEMATRGDLRELLLSMRPDPGERVPGNTPNIFLMYSRQIALGMQYLSAKGFVHRDLAARNVLVSDSNVCKVADFGMSRDLADENYYVSHGGKVPVKWTAPEALHYKKYSTASDVWAYGCLLYEIWSVGYKPFEGVPNVKALRLVDSGKRLSPPPGSPRMIYELMIQCWHPETSLRPKFRNIVLTLVGSEQKVLNIPEEDSSSNPLAGVLGAPLEAGENMYTRVQKRYNSDEVAI